MLIRLFRKEFSDNQKKYNVIYSGILDKTLDSNN